MYLVYIFFLTLSHLLEKQSLIIVFELRCVIAPKIAKILAAQVLAQPVQNSCGASAVAARKIVCGASAHLRPHVSKEASST